MRGSSHAFCQTRFPKHNIRPFFIFYYLRIHMYMRYLSSPTISN